MSAAPAIRTTFPCGMPRSLRPRSGFGPCLRRFLCRGSAEAVVSTPSLPRACSVPHARVLLKSHVLFSTLDTLEYPDNHDCAGVYGSADRSGAMRALAIRRDCHPQLRRLITSLARLSKI